MHLSLDLDTEAASLALEVDSERGTRGANHGPVFTTNRTQGGWNAIDRTSIALGEELQSGLHHNHHEAPVCQTGDIDDRIM